MSNIKGFRWGMNPPSESQTRWLSLWESQRAVWASRPVHYGVGVVALGVNPQGDVRAVYTLYTAQRPQGQPGPWGPASVMAVKAMTNGRLILRWDLTIPPEGKYPLLREVKLPEQGMLPVPGSRGREISVREVILPDGKKLLQLLADGQRLAEWSAATTVEVVADGRRRPYPAFLRGRGSVRLAQAVGDGRAVRMRTPHPEEANPRDGEFTRLLELWKELQNASLHGRIPPAVEGEFGSIQVPELAEARELCPGLISFPARIGPETALSGAERILPRTTTASPWLTK